MRVLLVHNFYQSDAPSGEDTVYRDERALLEANGVKVIIYERHSDELKGAGTATLARTAFDTAWSQTSQREISSLIAHTKPDIAHFHNTFPLITPSAYAACTALRVPVVQTLHNYRLICPGAMLFREGKPCEDCLGNSLLPALMHRCYRKSFAATATVVRMLTENRKRGTYASQVARYIALTEFARGRFVAGGIAAERIDVKPNGLTASPTTGAGNGGFVVYVGRLSEEKGVRTLVDAWSQLSDVRLKIVGDGPLRRELEEISRLRALNIEFMGRVDRSQLPSIVGAASLAIVPSLWFEGFPMVVVEAFACGTPVIASRLGSLAEIVLDGTTGQLFSPGDPSALCAAVRATLAARDQLQAMRMRARTEFEQRYSPAANFRQLMEVYRRVLADAKLRSTAARHAPDVAV